MSVFIPLSMLPISISLSISISCLLFLSIKGVLGSTQTCKNDMDVKMSEKLKREGRKGRAERGRWGQDWHQGKHRKTQNTCQGWSYILLCMPWHPEQGAKHNRLEDSKNLNDRGASVTRRKDGSLGREACYVCSEGHLSYVDIPPTLFCE